MINVETSHADVVVEEKNIVRTKQQMWICKLAGLKIEYSPLAPLRTLVNVSCQLQVGILKRENRKSWEFAALGRGEGKNKKEHN